MSSTDSAKEIMFGRTRRGSSRSHRIDARSQGADVAVPLETSTNLPASVSELPPPGPSNIIVLGANPLPVPRNVESQ